MFRSFRSLSRLWFGWPSFARPRPARRNHRPNFEILEGRLAPAGNVLGLGQFGTDGNDEVGALWVDASDHVYIAGSTSGTLPGQTSLGGQDAFVNKLDSTGQVIWTRQFGSTANDWAYGVSVDDSGKVYVVGSTEGTLPGQTSAGGEDTFVCMFDSSGTLIWTRQFGSTANDWPNGMSLDAAGHIYVAGSTDGTLPGQTSVGGKDAFLRQYDNAGNVIWTRQFGTTANDWAGGVCVDAAGHVYVADSTLGTLPGQTNAGAIDAMVSQFDSAGTLVWARQFGAAEDDWALGVTVDSAGHLFVTGWTFGTLPGQTSAGGIDAFVRQYDSTGNEIWTRQFGSFDDDYAWGISRDSSNHLYVTGWTFGTLPGQTCAWEIDAFVRQYDSDGNEVWTHQFGTAENDWAMGAQVDSSGSVIVAGHTEGTMPGQTSAGKVDVFLLKTPATVSSSALVADFPGAGLWLYSANSWQQLSPYSSEMAVVTNDGNVVADYGVSGLWRWTTAGWQQLTSANPQNLVVDVNGAVVAGFGAAGLWRWTAGGGWQQLTSANAQELAVDGNGAVTADFGAAGLWRWTTASWQQLTFVDAQGIAVDFWGAVTADLGAYGLWRWATGVWQQLTYVDPQSIALDAWGAVTANLVGNGLWRWTSVGWELLTSVDAQGIAVDAWGAVTADLGIYGLWRWTTLGWEQLTSSDPVSIAVDGSETLLATFANAGIWRYSNKEGWVQITSANPYYTAVN